MRQSIFFLSILFFLSSSILMDQGRAEFYGSAPTGLLVLEKKYPYYLFVPQEYSPEKGWPLVVLLGDTSDDPMKLVDQWLDWAKKNQVFLLVGTVFPREGSVPQEVDEWWVRIKKEVTERYRVTPSQILLVGLGTGAHYGGYLGLKYPEEFSAAALFRKAWPGPFEKVAKPTTNPKDQIPFYVAVDPEGKNFQAVERKAAELEKKGYLVTLDPLKNGEDLSGHRDRMMNWFLQGTETRVQRGKAKPKGGLKKKLQEMRKNVFEI